MKIKIIHEQFKKTDKYTVLTSHNGNQWSGGGLLTIREIEELRDKLSEFLKSEDKSGEWF